MGSLIDEERHLGNCDSSLLTPQPKCKRQKVSAPREFPCEYGPNEAAILKQTGEKVVHTIGELNVDDILKEVLKDIGSFGENGGDTQEAERRGLVEHMGQPGYLNGLELKKSHLVAGVKVRLENDELKNLSVTEIEKGVIVEGLLCAKVSAKVSNGKKRGYDARDNQQRYLTRSKHNAEKLAGKTVLNIPNPKETETDEFSRSSTVRDNEAYSEDKVKEPAKLSPSRFSEKVSKGKKCGGYDSRDNQQRYLTRSKHNAEKLAEQSVLITPNLKKTETDKCSRPLARNKRSYDARDNQQCYPTRNKYNVEKLEEKFILITPNPKEMEIDEFSRPLALGDDEDYCENEVKRPSKLSPSRDSANVSKGRKCAYDARENQQRYLTRSKYNAEKMAEKSVLIIPNPKETDTDKFSRPLALGDDESYSEAEVKGLANLSPSPVNAKVSKGQKCDYNARDNQQRYPSRSKLNAEKGTEKSILISPNLKEAETDKVSKPLALGENEDYSEDAGNGAAKLSPSLVSAKVSRGKKRDYDARHIQQRYPTRNKLNAEKVTEKSILISPNSKETETDKVSQPLASGDDEDYSEDAVNGAAKLSPSLVSAKVSRGKKRDYDARHIQQRYPTRSKLNAEKVTEKSILMSPNPKETGTDKVSQPLALGDDEDNCEDAVNGAAKLSPSLVSAKVSRGKKGDYDARHIQQRYPMRNKLNAEKVTEKPILISPNLKETKTDKVSQPLAPGDDEDYSEDAVNGAAKLSPSLVSAKVSRGMKRDYDARHIQQRYPTRSKLNAEKVTEKSIFISPNPKNMETDEFSRPLACEDDEDTEVVKAAAKLSPSWVSENLIKGKKRGYDAQESAEKLAQKSVQIIPDPKEAETDKFSRPLALGDDEDYSADEEHDTELRPRSRHCDITISPFVVCSSGEEGARTKVRETLKLFHVLVRKILQGEETNSIEKGTGKRVHMRVANILKEKGIYINTEKVIGAVPGVAIGDIYSYRLELAIIGLHTSLLNGIDTVKQEKLYVATSVVASEGYNNDVGNSDILIYTGEDRNPMGVDKHPEDQKLERGNLALKNCIDKKSPVRVIRFKEAKPSDTDDERHKMVGIYTYDGLYTVERYWPERGPHGKLVYKFELIRMPGQRQLAFKGVKQSKSRKVREGHCVYDISNGKEKLPIGAVNTVNDEKPPPFTYISSTMYPNWCQPLPPKGCDCKGGCSDSNLCACAVKNGGDIPYNRKGAIVEAKPLVYECGPSCKCPPSCPNRVSQRGIKLPLEIFKTESMGWGVRCRSYIPSGSFICEYIGELLDDKEAEERVGSDEYLFDVGKNYNDTTLSDELSELMPNMPSINAVENIGFTIDAALYGNIGRFVNHSCSPNLYAQNVLYDHEDERIPHVMLFATENIPPLQELTYHYNYTIDQVFDSKGNIKKKSCYCGSDECTGRMY